MTKTTIYRRTMTKKRIRLRFRLTDGRNVQLFHKSGIEIDAEELERYNDDGTLKKRVLKSPQRIDMQSRMQEEIALMETVYQQLKGNGINMTSQIFDDAIERQRNPEEPIQNADTLINRFASFIEEYYEGRNIGKERYKAYKVLHGILSRYLIIKRKSNYRPIDFKKRDLIDFRQFLFGEYKYVQARKALYKDVKHPPTEMRSQNTVSSKLKALNTFFNVLQINGEMVNENGVPVPSPFSLTKQEQSTMMAQRYNEPVCLHSDEYQKIKGTTVPESLQVAKDAFMVMCALGCRISDMKRMRMEMIKVSGEGIPYVSYKPVKTRRVDKLDDSIDTPIIYSALETIKKYNFSFKILNNERGHEGFNEKIRKILKLAGINRLCKVYNEDTGENIDTPLYELGSSKLARKTFVDMIDELQIDSLAAGLHRSDAVKRYQDNGIMKRFKLICAAFAEPLYKVDRELNVLEDSVK